LGRCNKNEYHKEISFFHEIHRMNKNFPSDTSEKRGKEKGENEEDKK
jgi:hypothetical protein